MANSGLLYPSPNEFLSCAWLAAIDSAPNVIPALPKGPAKQFFRLGECDKMTALDRFDAEAFIALLCAPFDRALWEEAMAEDCHLRVGNGYPRIGRHAALPELERLLRAIDQVGADYCDAWQRRETIIVETDLTLFSRGIRTAVVPCAIFARVTAKKLRDLRFYLDPAPLRLEGARSCC